jgi:hypothetical protein
MLGLCLVPRLVPAAHMFVSASVLSRGCSVCSFCRRAPARGRWCARSLASIEAAWLLLATEVCSVWAEVVAWLWLTSELLLREGLSGAGGSEDDGAWWPAREAGGEGNSVYLGLLFACASFELCEETQFRWRTLHL